MVRIKIELLILLSIHVIITLCRVNQYGQFIGEDLSNWTTRAEPQSVILKNMPVIFIQLTRNQLIIRTGHIFRWTHLLIECNVIGSLKLY